MTKPSIISQSKLDQSTLIKHLYYNSGTGLFSWANGRVGASKGATAGHKRDSGYIVIRVLNTLYKAHRLAVLYMTGAWPKEQVDHINHIRDDNRWVNLREVSGRENSRNQIMSKFNKSGFTGVFFCAKNKRWQANVRVENNKSKFLGYFDSFEDAVLARKAANIKYGYHANHGL